MQTLDQSGSVAESAFRLFRLFLNFLVFFAGVAACHWGIRHFLLCRGGKSDRWRNLFSAVNAGVLVLLLILRAPAERLLIAAGDAISRLRPESELGWLIGMLVGLYYALIASSILFVVLYGLGLAYRFADARIHAWQAQLHQKNTPVESNPRYHASRVMRIIVRLLRNLLAAALVLGYFFYGLANFPRTEIFTNALRKLLAPPLQDAARAVENYVPNLGYLFVILLFAWMHPQGLEIPVRLHSKREHCVREISRGMGRSDLQALPDDSVCVRTDGELSLSAGIELGIFSRFLGVHWRPGYFRQ